MPIPMHAPQPITKANANDSCRGHLHKLLHNELQMDLNDLPGPEGLMTVA